MGKFIDLTGKRFGRLTVIRMLDGRKNNHIVWECKCDCGTICNIRGYSMRYGKTKSCGCLEKENLHSILSANSKHEYQKDPYLRHIYAVWKGMRGRCNRLTNSRYHRYGGRGISVCKEWNNPINFVNWAMSHGYKRGLTLDRIDNNGNYCPENCRFVSIRDNNRNSSNTHLNVVDIENIRAEYRRTHRRQVDIAADYGITQQTVSRIINFRPWKN